MYRFDDLTGRVFNRLTVIKMCDQRNKRRDILWHCKCVCGNNKIVASNALKTKHVQSCGCLRKESERLRNRKRPYEYLYNSLKKVAKSRNHKVDFSYTEFISFTKIIKCHYCHTIINWYPYASRDNGSKVTIRYNLDRMNNTEGYTLKNCVVCCKRCNIGRNEHFSYDEWYTMTRPFRTGELVKCQS